MRLAPVATGRQSDWTPDRHGEHGKHDRSGLPQGPLVDVAPNGECRRGRCGPTALGRCSARPDLSPTEAHAMAPNGYATVFGATRSVQGVGAGRAPHDRGGGAARGPSIKKRAPMVHGTWFLALKTRGFIPRPTPPQCMRRGSAGAGAARRTVCTGCVTCFRGHAAHQSSPPTAFVQTNSTLRTARAAGVEVEVGSCGDWPSVGLDT